MAIFSTVLTRVVKRHVLEICDKNPSFLPFVYSMCRNYVNLRNTSHINYACSQTIYTPCMFSMFNDQAKINVRYYSTGKKSKRSYYDVLGVTPNATQSQIKTAYYTLSKQHHPDTKTGDKENVIFLELNEAYEVLGNHKKRRLYDRGIFIPHIHQNVQDNKHDHEEEGPESGFQSPINQNIKKRRVYTGASKIYNFDEHYRQHYGSLLNRKREADENIRRRQRLEKEAKIEKDRAFFFSLATVIFIFVGYLTTWLPK